jgi:glycosyltransferase involved in cell wall biosynthesis
MIGLKKIGIDCRMIKESGIGRYIENLVLNLNSIESEIEFYLFVFSKNDFNLNLNSNFKIIEAPFVWHGFEEQTKFLKLINSYNLDLYHSPHPNMPYLYFKDYIITIHDLTMLKEKTGRASTYSFPVYFLKWLVFKTMLWLAVLRAKKIITVSSFVKNQIVSEFRIKPSKVEVIYNGVTDSIHKVNSPTKIKQVKDRLGLQKPFLFYIGNAYPHKNLERLILAFELFNNNGEYQLVLGGKEDYFYKRLKVDYSNLPNISFAGYLNDDEVSSLYSSCVAFIYPSISEGFGIQIIEALKTGSKVICSNNSCFPEIAGKFAYYFNPFDIEDIKKTITISLKQPNKSDMDGVEKHLEKFDWKKSALNHYEIYKKS